MSDTDTDRDAIYVRVFWRLLLGVTALRVAILWLSPLDLSFDEAYYWLWSQSLDWCYFSKGPGIALTIRVGTALGGDSTFGVRLSAVLCSAATGAIAFCWARDFFGEARRALFLILLLGAAPMLAAGGLLTTIDAPFFLAWTAATAALWRALTTDRIGWWAATGAALAAGLLCKFTTGFFLIGLLGLALTAERWMLRRPGPYLALAVAALGLLPVLIWNAQHDWITIVHTADKASTDADRAALVNAARPAGLTLRHLPESFGQQFGALSPVIFVGVLLSIGHLLRDAAGLSVWGPHEPLDRRRAAFLLAGAVPILGFYAGLAFHRVIPANWPVAGYLTALAAAAWYWARPWNRFQRITFWGGLALGLALQGPLVWGDLLYELRLPERLVALGVPWKPKYDITNRLSGWSEFGRAATQRAQAHADASGRPVFFLSEHYSHAAWLSFYADRRFSAHVVPPERPRNQFDIWRLEGRVPPVGADAVILYEPDKGRPELAELFADGVIDDPQPLVLHRAGEPIREFGVLIGRGFRGFSPSER